jgi:hypothetical protein
MKSLIVLLSVFMMSTTFAEAKKECKKKGYKYDKRKQSCSDEMTSKRKRCEKNAGTWSESSGKCSGKLKGKEKRAFKIVQKAAKKSRHGKKLSTAELVELAKDLASYAKKKKVRLKKIKIKFDTTEKKENTTGEQLEEVSSKQGVKLYHIDEGSRTVNTPTEKIDINIETMEKDIEIPTNFFPPNEYNYTSEGKAGLLNAIIDEDESWHIFNVTIVESSASKLANTAGKYDFKSGDSDSVKQRKLKGLALARSSETAKMLMQELPDITVIDKKNAIVSGPRDVFGTGDQSGEEPPGDIASAAKNLNSRNRNLSSRNRKKITEFYNQYQYVKLKVEYMKETKEVVKVLEDNKEVIPNAEGILAKFSQYKKIKKRFKRIKISRGFKLKIKRRKRTKRYKPERRRGKTKYKILPCPKW